MEDDVCPGALITFTCITDTTSLTWQRSGTPLGTPYVFGTSTIGSVQQLSGVTLNLTSISGNTLTSTATIAHITESVTLQCDDSGGTIRSRTVGGELIMVC